MDLVVRSKHHIFQAGNLVHAICHHGICPESIIFGDSHSGRSAHLALVPVQKVRETVMSQPVWFLTMLDSLPSDVLEEWDERSAILQYDAGFSREHSECLALLLVISKHKLTL